MDGTHQKSTIDTECPDPSETATINRRRKIMKQKDKRKNEQNEDNTNKENFKRGSTNNRMCANQMTNNKSSKTPYQKQECRMS